MASSARLRSLLLRQIYKRQGAWDMDVKLGTEFSIPMRC